MYIRIEVVWRLKKWGFMKKEIYSYYLVVIFQNNKFALETDSLIKIK